MSKDYYRKQSKNIVGYKINEAFRFHDIHMNRYMIRFFVMRNLILCIENTDKLKSRKGDKL